MKDDEMKDILETLVEALKQAGRVPIPKLCFWCGEATDVDFVPKDQIPDGLPEGTATYSISPNYNPCPSCKSSFEEGIVAIEIVQEKQTPNQPEIAEGVGYPTGRFVVFPEEELEKFGLDTEREEHVKKVRQMALSSESWEKAGFPTGPTWLTNAQERMVNPDDVHGKHTLH